MSAVTTAGDIGQGRGGYNMGRIAQSDRINAGSECVQAGHAGGSGDGRALGLGTGVAVCRVRAQLFRRLKGTPTAEHTVILLGRYAQFRVH